MKAEKATSILAKVAETYPLDGDAILKFEYSNETFHKANLEIHDIELTSSKIIIKLFVPATDCKAKELCGVPESALAEEVQNNSCAPGSGCC